MAVCRVEKNTDYTTMSNYHLRDMDLSLKAKGLLSLILSLPEDWDYTIAGLACICREGKDAVRAGIAELESAGYIQRRQTHDETGAFAGNEYVIFEAPQPPLSENPSTGNPSTGNPLTENPTEQNKDIQSKEEITPHNPPAKKPPADKSEPKWKPERFAGFWAFYPRKVDRKKAIRAWDKLKPSDELIDEMASALKWQTKTEQWQEIDKIPYPSSWLNGERWKDERPPASLPEAPAEPYTGGMDEAQRRALLYGGD